ncbi:MAG: putative lipid II flippase FtsW [Coriobacteriaceae bacterium]|nr:putative lipid II flippase FtsW [Coriobacteriaceae bacterium]
MPERFMRPRLILIAVVVILTCFGFLMVYSASSVTSLTSEAMGNDPAYYLKRQLAFAAMGAGIAAFIASRDYHIWGKRLVGIIWALTIGLLLLIFLPIAGSDAYGATRWVAIGPLTLQPSEFAKITIILVAADQAERYYDEQTVGFQDFVKNLAVFVGVPLVLILLQPDKGSTLIIAATLIVMAYLAGMDRRWILIVLAVGVAAALVLSLKDDYSRARIVTMLDPWSDPTGSGYQLIQGFYAFGSGGLFGVGLGMSRQKYSYLPMAYNDFIFAVVGEELGLVGTLGVLAAFGVLAWAGFRIARYAPDMCGRLIAAGCTSLIVIQLLVNVCGVLGLIPLSGKPVPFVSYGGSTIMSCLMLVGVLVSVSAHSTLPETVHDRSRQSWQFADGQGEARGPATSGDPGISLVGTPTPRSSRPRGDAGPGLRMVDGGGRAHPQARPRGGGSRTGGRGSCEGERIDLGPSAAERLRGRGSGRGDGRRGRN